MDSILIGYFPKRRYRRGDPPPEGVGASFPVPEAEEVCSVSGCIAGRPERWTEDLNPNEFWGFESPDSAWAAVFAEDRPEFDLCAYRLFPVRFADGNEVALELPQVTVDPMPNYYVRLGYDVVELLGEACCFHFGCSPLTCNSQAYQAGVKPVNRYCLMDLERDAFDLARVFSVSKPEPGPYSVVEVWRDERGVLAKMGLDSFSGED